MADRYLLESGAPDGYLLEDGTGVMLLETPPAGRIMSSLAGSGGLASHGGLAGMGGGLAGRTLPRVDDSIRETMGELVG